jgi:hypothetical protein
MKRNRHQRNLLLGSVLLGATAIGFSTPATSLAENADPTAACQKLATLTPVSPTQITLAKFNPAGATSANGKTLLAHCQVQGIINKRTGADGLPYGDRFEVRLPIPAERFMFQGGGGTEGAVPPAIGYLADPDAPEKDFRTARYPTGARPRPTYYAPAGDRPAGLGPRRVYAAAPDLERVGDLGGAQAIGSYS